MPLEHDLPLISTMAIGLSLAFVTGFVASSMRISPIIGYLIAGFIIGPHTPGYVASQEIAHELSEIGIVLLMFGVGLHFSFRDLMEVKYIAVTGALVQILITALAAIGLASFWGWPLESTLLYGLALSVASTVVLLRSLEQNKLQYSIEGRIAIGWLIVEDLIMILALVLIPVLAQTDGMEASEDVGSAIVIAVGKVILFGLFMGIAGRKAFPFMLAAVNKTGSRELFTLSVLVAAIGVAFAAAQFFDVSLALGAFFAGMIINSSTLNEEVAARALPFQDAFAVLFFVSIGMLFDPAILFQQPGGVIATSVIIILCKFIVSSLIVLAFSYALKRALHVSAGLAQIGEFSFILVGMGLAMGLLPQEGGDLVLAGAFISIALNPLVFRASERLHTYVEEHPVLSKRFAMNDKHTAPPSTSAPVPAEPVTRKRAILVGYGRLGQQVLEDSRNSGLELVVIDSNRERIDILREKGFEAIAGDAADETTLKEAQIDRVAVILIMVPDPFETQRIVETVKIRAPSTKIVARATSDEEMEYLQNQDIDQVLFGRREIGKTMSSYLNNLGLQEHAASRSDV